MLHNQPARRARLLHAYQYVSVVYFSHSKLYYCIYALAGNSLNFVQPAETFDVLIESRALPSYAVLQIVKALDHCGLPDVRGLNDFIYDSNAAVECPK